MHKWFKLQKVSFTVVVGESFKDDQGNCWVYNGRFEVDYIAPPSMTPITFQGDYFANAPSTVYTSCDDCLTPVTTPQQTVISVSAGMQPCIGGTIDDYSGGICKFKCTCNCWYNNWGYRLFPIR